MGINSNATSINEQMSFYSTLSMVLLVVAIIFFITAIVLWFVFKIPHSFRVLTGVGVDKEIREISSATKTGNEYAHQSHNKAVITWNTSGMLNRVPASEEETALLLEDSDSTTVLESEETQLLGVQPTPNQMWADETIVLNQSEDAGGNMPSSSDFEIEEEIIITGTDKKL